MPTNLRKQAAWAAVLTLGLGVAASAAAPAKYHVDRTMKLGGEGRWDYVTMDSDHGRLYISRSSHVQVLDIASGKVVGDIPGTEGVHGIALAPRQGRGFTSNGKGNDVTIFDLKTLKSLGQVKTGENPDAIVYDPASQRVFTFNGKSKGATAIDAASGKVLGTIALGARPEFAVADGKGMIYDNMEDTGELVAIDSKGLKVVHRWKLAGCEDPSGLAIDPGHGRLFSVCDNKVMAVTDAGTGKQVAKLPIGEGPDAAGFDPATGLAFSSNGDGTLTVVHEESPNHFVVAENVQTRRGARTMALDLKTHKIYLPTAEFGPAPAATKEQPHPRPSILPESFVILEVAPAK